MTTQELISARSNEANLGQEEFAWLLFGIHDKIEYKSLLLERS